MNHWHPVVRQKEKIVQRPISGIHHVTAIASDPQRESPLTAIDDDNAVGVESVRIDGFAEED